MGPIAIIALLVRLMVRLPELISVIKDIIALLKGSGSFRDVLSLIGQILALIIGVLPTDKTAAGEALKELRDVLRQVDESPESKRRRLEELKRKVRPRCEGVGCPSQPVRE